MAAMARTRLPTSTRCSPTRPATRAASRSPATRAAPAPTRRCASWSARSACATTSPRSPRGSTSAPSRPRSSRRSSLAAEAWGARRTWFLINGASQGNHAICLALAHAGDAGRRPAQRPLLGDRRAGAERHAAELRRARARPRARDRPLPDAGRAGRGARRDARARSRAMVVSPTYFGACADVAGLADGRPRARRAAGRRRGLGRPPALPPRPAARRAQPAAPTWSSPRPTRSSAA